ncbi:MAG: PDZ domain-containing protein, partial [Gemmobacter sp.]|nr:PDZ domain-containing protein [Gemmobacter sp.]
GVILSDVHAGSPFRAAGLRSGDVVVRLDGAPVNSPQEMMFRLSARGVGGTVGAEYLRDGQTMHANVPLIAPPDSPPRDQRTIVGNVVLRGLQVARLNPAVMAELDLSFEADGVVVVDATDLAMQAGLQRGDVLLAINGARIEDPSDVDRAARAQVRLWEIDLIRGGNRLRLRFRV